MDNHRILLCWIAGFALVGTFVVIRIAIPWLVNMQNTGALVLAFLLGGATITADYRLFKEIIVPLWNEEKGQEDHE